MKKSVSENYQKQLSFFRKFLLKNGSYHNVSRLFFLSELNEDYSYKDIRASWESFIRQNAGKDLLRNVDLYIHIPFCKSRCAYCSFPSGTSGSVQKIDRYVEYLSEAVKYFQKTFSSVRFRNLYIGGGTPNMLNARQMEKLLSTLFERFSFVEDPRERIRTCEFNVSIGDLSTLKILAKYGFDRISFGVQSLDKKTLVFAGRGYQDFNRLSEAVSLAKELGFKIINTDLIAGLPGDTPQTFSESFLKLIGLRPTTIIVYGLYPPNDAYIQDNFRMNYQEYFQKYYPGAMKKFMRRAYPIAEKRGYVCSPFDLSRFHWQFDDPEYAKIWAQAEGFGSGYGGEFSACLPSSTFGLGPFSRSRIYGALEYQHKDNFEKFSEKKNFFSGRPLTAADEMLKFIVGSLEQGPEINARNFSKVFGRGIEGVFPHSVRALTELKKMKRNEDGFRIICRRPEDKYLSALFFIYESMVKNAHS